MTGREYVDDFSDAVTEGGGEGLITMVGYDDCIAGIGQRFTDYFVIYDFEKVIAKLVSSGMTREEAIEFHEHSHLGAWDGNTSPVFMHLPPNSETE